MNPRFLSRLRVQTRIWAVHCAVTAAPSLIVAFLWIGLGRNPTAAWAPLAAIATFIFVCSTLAALSDPLNTPGHLLYRTLKATMKVRILISMASSAFVLSPLTGLLTPDVWCGAVIVLGLRWLAERSGLPFPMDPSESGFLLIYGISILQGIALAMMSTTIGFFVHLVIQSRDRKAGRLPGIAEK